MPAGVGFCAVYFRSKRKGYPLDPWFVLACTALELVAGV